jgi:hypothetical protein
MPRSKFVDLAFRDRPICYRKVDGIAHDRTAFPIDWILEAVIRGVLRTRLALAMGGPPDGLGLEPGGVRASPRLAIMVDINS